MPEGNQEWAMWANEHAFISGVVDGAGVATPGETFGFDNLRGWFGGVVFAWQVMIMGGITGTIGFDGYQFAIYSIVAGLVVCLLEYARSCRRKGSTVERRFQSFLQPVMMLGSPLTTNYYVRFILYLVLCIPCAFQLPTLIGGISLLIAALIYFKAALGGESWTTAKAPKRQKTLTDRPPVNPPPRPPPEAVAHKNGAYNNGYDPNNPQ